MKTIEHKQETVKRIWFHHDGKTYFSRETERKIFFFLTVFMLVAGIAAKLGFF